MDLTDRYRALILSGLRASKVSKTELAEEMGFGKSWVTKLLNGTLKSVSDKDAKRIEDLLGIQFVRFVDKDRTVSDLAREVDRIAIENPQFAKPIHLYAHPIALLTYANSLIWDGERCRDIFDLWLWFTLSVLHPKSPSKPRKTLPLCVGSVRQQNQDGLSQNRLNRSWCIRNPSGMLDS